jgi:hypothetical protein
MAPRFGRRPWVLAAVVLAVVAAAPYGYRAWQAAGTREAVSTRGPTIGGGRPSFDPGYRAAGPLEVHLERLTRPRPEPTAGERSPFRFEEPSAPRVGLGIAPRPPAGPPQTPTSSEPTPPPPIPLKFIGLVEGSSGTGRVAVLSDGRFVYQGREGDIIDGRYRLVRIGVESVVLEYLDGRGRQTVRLSGS